MNRRDFMKATAGVAAAFALRGQASAYAVSPGLRKFIDPLPIFGAQIPILTPDTVRYPGVDYYEIVAGMFRQSLSSDMKRLYAGYGGTRLYGYAADNAAPKFAALGGAIVATKGRPVRIKYRSNLPAAHIIPFDPTLSMATGMAGAQNRISVHLHGGLVPWASDGGPFHWVDPAGIAGVSNVKWLPNDLGALTNDLFYPNLQTARFMWYHDHAMGTTRTSAYAGLASGYIISDSFDAAVDSTYPLGAGKTFILVFQDKVFYNPAIDPGFAAAAGGATAGDLWYPYVYDKAIWKYQGNAKEAPSISAIPEMFGDTMLVNGCVFPAAAVDRGAYRVRTLNACNARFLNLKFVYADTTGAEPLGGYLAPTVAPVNAFMIGTEGGFLPSPVQIFASGRPVNAANLTPWLQAPAERSDMIIDFSRCSPGSKVLLYNDAPAPYPMGAPIFDYYPGAPKNPNAAAILPGSGPNTRTIMQFSISSARGLPVKLPVLSGANPVLPTIPDLVNGGLQLGAVTGTSFANYIINPIPKEITLNEMFDVYGRLTQLVGTNVAMAKGTFGRAYMDPVSETVTYGTIEIWNVYNLTSDVHPMHFHLFNAKILRRRPFRNFNGAPSWAGPGRAPDAGEEGWKETVKMWPGECCTIAVLVEHPMPAALYPQPGGRPTVTVAQKPDPLTGVAPPPVTGTLPISPRIGGDEYVYHCHILEHEEHDMMRPLQAL